MCATRAETAAATKEDAHDAGVTILLSAEDDEFAPGDASWAYVSNGERSLTSAARRAACWSGGTQRAVRRTHRCRLRSRRCQRRSRWLSRKRARCAMRRRAWWAALGRARMA